MYTFSDLHELVAALPAELLTRIIRTNAQYDILGDADQKLGWGNKVLASMQDELFSGLCTLIGEAIALMPAEIQNEQPTEDGEYILQGDIEHILRRL